MPSASWHTASLEERARQFIAADIEQGIICADLAARAIAPEHAQWRKHLIESALKAHEKATQRRDSSAAWGCNFPTLRARLGLLGDMVAGLQQTRREAA